MNGVHVLNMNIPSRTTMIFIENLIRSQAEYAYFLHNVYSTVNNVQNNHGAGPETEST